MSQKDNRMSPFIALQLRSTLMPSSPLKLDVKMTAYSKNGFIQPFVAMLKGPISVTEILLLRGYLSSWRIMGLSQSSESPKHPKTHDLR